MRIIVTGGLGFIGSNYIRHHLAKHPEDSIINLDLMTYAGNPENLADIGSDPGYRFVKGDICDAKLVDSLAKEADAILHFAAESHVDRSIEDAGSFVRTNVMGTQVLLDAALRNGKLRFHHISTDEVFGALGETGRFDEKTPYDPRSPYSASKAASDHLVRSFFHTHRLPITITNCSNNYGPYQFPEKVIPLFITNLLEGKKVPLYGKGQNIRDWIHVLDHCEAISLVLRKGRMGETYCVGGDCEMRNIDLTLAILESFGKGTERIENVPDRKGHDYRYAIDSSKIRRELGWKPKYDFSSGLKETIDWYKENSSWWKRLKGRET